MPAAWPRSRWTRTWAAAGWPLLYGLNTLGAVVGCCLANFILLEAFGTRRMLWGATALRGLRGALRLGLVAQTSGDLRRSAADQDGDAHVDAAPGFVLFAAGWWFRILSDGAGVVPHAGAAPRRDGIQFRNHSGAGSAWHRPRQLLHGLPNPVAACPPACSVFAGICLAEAAAIALPFAIGDGVALLALFLLPLRGCLRLWRAMPRLGGSKYRQASIQNFPAAPRLLPRHPN